MNELIMPDLTTPIEPLQRTTPFMKKISRFFKRLPLSSNRYVAAVELLVGIAILSIGPYVLYKTIPFSFAGDGVAYSFSTTKSTLMPGEETAIAVNINTGTYKVSATELHITYDATKLDGVSIAAGTYLPVVLKPGSIADGKASITLGSNPADPKLGSGIVATLVVRAKTTLSTTQLAFDPLKTLTAAIGYTGTVTGTLTPLTITIANPSPSPTSTTLPQITPSISPSPSPSPSPTASGKGKSGDKGNPNPGGGKKN